MGSPMARIIGPVDRRCSLSVLFAFFSFLLLSPVTEHSPQRQQQVPPAAACTAGPTPTHHDHPPPPLPKKVCAGPLQTHWQHSLTPQPFLHSNPPTFRYKDGWISSVLACYAEDFFFFFGYVCPIRCTLKGRGKKEIIHTIMILTSLQS